VIFLFNGYTGASDFSIIGLFFEDLDTHTLSVYRLLWVCYGLNQMDITLDVLILILHIKVNTESSA
jgi:hypothetical protein